MAEQSKQTALLGEGFERLFHIPRSGMGKVPAPVGGESFVLNRAGGHELINEEKARS